MTLQPWLSKRIKALALIAPLALFLALFFLAPLVTMMKTARALGPGRAERLYRRPPLMSNNFLTKLIPFQ